jgi:hypothetical protein
MVVHPVVAPLILKEDSEHDKASQSVALCRF